jgi:AraC-like DNA-binding protein
MSRYTKASSVIRGSVTVAIHVRTLQALVNQHFRELKLPSDYAEKMKLSSRQLNMICKQATGKKATDIIHDRIIIEAKRQLAYSEKNLKQIALSLGYKDISYFMRFFKNKTKQTPDQFRRSVEYVESVKPTYIS